jgi:quercetin dioxygenase-like cupin family protein
MSRRLTGLASVSRATSLVVLPSPALSSRLRAFARPRVSCGVRPFQTTTENFMKKLLVLAALIAVAGSALAQDAMKSTRVKPDELTWKANPSLPPGAQVATLTGDPTKAEVVVQRVKLPPNYKVPPHTHPVAEYGTVISGSIGLGDGEKFEAKGDMSTAGTFYVRPVKHAHYAWTGSEGAIIQVQFTGPGAIDYVNPADDPRKKTQ